MSFGPVLRWRTMSSLMQEDIAFNQLEMVELPRETESRVR